MSNFSEAKEISNLIKGSRKKKFEYTKSDFIDQFVAHKWLGLVLFAFIMYLVFTISQVWVGPFIADYLVAFIESTMVWIESSLLSLGVNELMTGLVVNGLIGGFAAVIGFLPLIMVLFFLLGLLEDSGYMARVALVMDRYFKKIGLSGKSVIPMYVSSGCAIPGIMSSKTIKDVRQRRSTILLSPFVPCGAKGPVIAMFIGVFFANKSYMTAIVYFSSILVILLAGFIINALTNADFKKIQEEHHLLVELPQYKIPNVKKALVDMWGQAKEFIIKASTIIVVANALIWFMSTFTWNLQVTTDASHSILASVSTPIAYLLVPLGFGVWQLAAAAITGFVAKEQVVATLTMLLMLENAINEDFNVVASDAVRNVLESPGIGLTTVSAFAYLGFILFTPPCFAAIGAMKTQLKNSKLTVFGIALQLIIGYAVAMVIYQVGTLVFYQQIGTGFVASIFILIGLISMFLYMKNLASKGLGLAKVE